MPPHSLTTNTSDEAAALISAAGEPFTEARAMPPEDPTHLVTLTPRYFWYLIVHPRGVGQVHVVFVGGLSPEFIADPAGPQHLATLKALLDRVNAEDRRGVEAVFRGVQAPLARPGQLSALERPNYDFARYLAQRIGAA